MASLKDALSNNNRPALVTSEAGEGSTNSKRISSLESDVKQLRAEVSAARDSDGAIREELQGVYGDVDALKANKQEVDRNILMVERAVAEVEEGEMAELRSRVDHMEDRMEDVDHFR